MSERILQALMQLFAIGATIESETSQNREAVELFLSQQISLQRIEEYLALYDNHYQKLTGSSDDSKGRKRIAVSSVKALRICTEINKELNTRQKYIVFMRLAEFMQSSGTALTQAELEFLDTVGSVFTIEQDEYILSRNITAPVLDASLLNSSLILTIGNRFAQNQFHVERPDIEGTLVLLHLQRANIFILRYTGQHPVTVNGQIIDISKAAVIAPGAVIRSPKFQAVYYNDIIRPFIEGKREDQFVFTVKNVEYVFSNGTKGLHELSLSIKSGNMVGIMGSSGAGKSTLLNILNGGLTPTSGQVLINSTDLHSNPAVAEGLMGNIPQDDLLIEELTVFQNLFYNTKLCFGNLSDQEITVKVDDVLEMLGLTQIKNLKVGNPLNKTISGGQRKRLNIALELIREPSILFVDEPTSGLSSRDAENVIDLLKQLAQEGKLIFVVVHQPSSDIFRMFDRLLMLDTGGYPVYFGDPADALIHFKRMIHMTDADQSECPVCGNINAEQLFNIIELHEVDEFGKATAFRRITPPDWYKIFKEKISPKVEVSEEKFEPAPYKKAGRLKQFKVFLTRDVLARLGNRQYMLINMLEAPLLAFILGFFLRYSSNGDYKFINNPNIPAYLFISVIVALFLGLSVSAEEIIRDRKIRQREKFLHLSKSAYLWSKVKMLTVISAIQTITFVLVGNAMMGIHDMTFAYWLILFTTSCFANMLGLNVSAGLDSAVTIYILIPFLIIPQILLSGVIVQFDKLNPAISKPSGVPLIGNVMISRWAFEALAVKQFADNTFNKQFYQLDKAMSSSTYKKDWWIPALQSKVDKCEWMIIQKATAKDLKSQWTIVCNSAKDAGLQLPKSEIPSLSDINTVRQTLKNERERLIDEYNQSSEKKEALVAMLCSTPEKEKEFKELKESYQNESLEEMVRNTNNKERLIETKDNIVQKYDPIYQNYEGSFSDAPLFVKTKKFFGSMISTFAGNILVIWSFTVFLFVTLYFDLLRKVINIRS